MKRLAWALALVTALGMAGIAAAKGPDRARVCGMACRTITGDQNVWPFVGTWLEGSFAEVDPPRQARFFTFAIDSTRGESGRWQIVWVPSKRVMRVTQVAVPPYQLDKVGPYWRPAPFAARGVFAAATRGLRARAGAYPRPLR
jgi:hypothetical protein